MSAIFGGARWDAFAHIGVLLDTLVEAEDGRGLLSPYVWVAAQANPAVLEAAIELGIRDGAHRLLDARRLDFNLLLDVDATAVGRWLSRRGSWPTSDGPTHLLGLLLHELGDHNGVADPIRGGYRSGRPSWPGSALPHGPDVIQLGSMLAYTDGDRTHLEWAIANLGEYRCSPRPRSARAGGVPRIPDGQPPTADSGSP